MALSIGIRNLISLLSAIQATRPLTITLVGLSPTEHTSFILDTPLCLDDSVLGGTSRQSNTHSSEVREIRYPWHPWYGRAVCIHGALVKGGQALYHCSLEQNHQAPLFQIPQWMFESGACCRMHRAEEPAVDCAALRDLRRLLHHTRSRSVRKSDRSVLGSPRVVSAARPMCKCIQFGCRSIPAR